MELIFASQNRHKRDEIAGIIGGEVNIITLSELNYFNELDESYNTLEDNALQKSRFVYNMFKKDCFSEDTGLEVDALNGEPGVKSARYAGEGKSAKDNIELLLKKMEGIKNRAARFRTVIALKLNGKEYIFEGICKGKISAQPSGSSGFGYDPVFIPDGYTKTFAEMGISVKNQISHRSKAVLELKKFIAEYRNNRA
jgi:XTP/dITP diphosphohydrolase